MKLCGLSLPNLNIFVIDSPGQVASRAVDELPWLVSQTGDKLQIEKCILDLGIFQQMCAR